MSHPVWVRGLKLTKSKNSFLVAPVAPRVGAWIETETGLLPQTQDWVAPRVGAWIETMKPARSQRSHKSHPVWVRGLKLVLESTYLIMYIVAPRVGAWIET